LNLVYTEAFQSKQEALARERYFKTPDGGALKQKLVSEGENRGEGC
jgi:predicted GIY-YIG superfamily endonuclease